MTRRNESPALALASAANWPDPSTVTTPMTALELQEAITLLRDTPDESGIGATGVVTMPICRQCHMTYNISGHEGRCDGTRPEALRHCLWCYPWKHKPGRGLNDDRLVRR